MKEVPSSVEPSSGSAENGTPRPSPGSRIQFWIYLAITVAVLVFLLWPTGERGGPAQGTAEQERPVRLIGTGLIEIEPGSSLHKKIQVSEVKPARTAAPLLTVTGTVTASLRSGKGEGRGWQFSSPELLTTHTDWQKAVWDIGYAQAQLQSIRQLAESRIEAQKALVARLEKLVAAGTETESDLAVARAELLQVEIQSRKDVYEAETAGKLAQRTEIGLNRQLQQAGVDSELLRLTSAGVDIIVADVPEAMQARVKRGQGCQARCMGVEAKVFPGTVQSILPVLSNERRSLRVLCTVDDPEDLLRPGMFADIGLGTDARDALLVPVAGVVHVGRTDFMLVRGDGATWRVIPVQVGELRDGAVEILSGLQSGSIVMGHGAILIKPLIIEALQGANLQATGG